MALELTALDPSELSPAVLRAAGPQTPAPAKMMTARGLAPLGPKDLAVAIYQLSRDSDPQLAQAAEQSADKLPDGILGAALGEPLDPRVLDFFSQKAMLRPALIEQILLNPQTSDETFVTLAGGLREEGQLEILAGNGQRMLRHPEIVEALYFNKAVRMSTVDRVLEFAVRNGITLDRVPNYKELAASIMQSGAQQAVAVEEIDAVFAEVLAVDYDRGPLGDLEYSEIEGEKKDELQKIGDLPVSSKIRLATLGNAFHRMTLIRDSNRQVALAAIKSPAISEQEVVRYAGDRGLSEDIVRYIAERREWQKNYAVKLALTNNAKCPLAHSMRLLQHLRPNDVRLLTRSKNVPAPLVQAAKRLTKTRT